jgi:hypothetical protein
MDLTIFKISQLDGVKENSDSPKARFTQMCLYMPLVNIKLPEAVLQIISFILCWSTNIQNNADKLQTS